jgi:predicted phosphodiesterase
MKIALTADIYGNLPALDAVLQHARLQGARAIWCLGDLVGYGPFPEEVVQQVRGEYILSTNGKSDRKVLRFKRRGDKWRRTKSVEEYVALEWTFKQLSKASRRYLRFLSREIRLTQQSKRVLLSHGTPDIAKQPFTPDTPEEELGQLALAAHADLIGVAHAPQAFARHVEGVWFVNPGSVGLPADGDPRASYALLEFGPQSINVQHHRVDYDVDRVLAALRHHELPTAFGRMFSEGLDLDTLLVAEASS